MRTKIDDDELVSFMNKIINQPEVSVKINFDAYDKSISRYNKYASDWKTQTKEGLEIKIRDITRLISRFKITLIEYEGTEYIDSIWFKKQIKILKNYLKSFNASLTRFENLESRISKNELNTTVKSKPSGIVVAWVVYFERNENDKSDKEAATRILKKYQWDYKPEYIRQIVSSHGKINGNSKINLLTKQRNELREACTLMKDIDDKKRAEKLLNR